MSGVTEMWWGVAFWRVKFLYITVAFHTPSRTTVLTCQFSIKTPLYLLCHLKPPKTRSQISPGRMIMTSLWAFITECEKDINYKVLFGKRDHRGMFNYYNPCGLFCNCYKNQNTSGDSKVTVLKRIGQVILPELFALDVTTVANRLRGQLERYVPTLDFTMLQLICLLKKAHKNVPEACCTTSADRGWTWRWRPWEFARRAAAILHPWWGEKDGKECIDIKIIFPSSMFECLLSRRCKNLAHNHWQNVLLQQVIVYREWWHCLNSNWGLRCQSTVTKRTFNMII